MSEEILCLVQLYICCCRKWQGVSEEESCIGKDILPQKEWNHNPPSLLWMLCICTVFFHCVCISLITTVIKNLCQDYVNSNWTPSPKSEVFPLFLHRCTVLKNSHITKSQTIHWKWHLEVTSSNSLLKTGLTPGSDQGAKDYLVWRCHRIMCCLVVKFPKLW